MFINNSIFHEIFLNGNFNLLLCFAGIIVIIALQFFTPYLVYIPKAALAAVIIAAVVFMVELHVVKPMWRTKSMYN